MSEHPEAGEERKLFGISAWRWSALSHLVAVLGIVSVVVGVIEYLQKIEADRAEKTIEMIDDWVDGGYRDAFLALGKSTEAAMDRLRPALDAAGDRTDAIEDVRSQIVHDVLSTDGAENRFDMVIYYFNRLGLCVEADVCSDRTAKIFFDDTLEDFLSVYGSEIGARRATHGGFAEGLLILNEKIQ